MQNQSSGICNHKSQLCIRGTLIAYPCGGLAYADRPMLLYQLTFQRQHIAGHDLTAEPGVFNTAEQSELTLILGQAQRCYGTGLS